MKHTPIPWHLSYVNGVRYICSERYADIATVHSLADGKNNAALEKETRDNHRFICLAVNNHADLVEKLEACLRVIQKLPNGHSADRVVAEEGSRALLSKLKEESR